MNDIKIVKLDIVGPDNDDIMSYLQEMIEVYELEIVGLWPVGPSGGASEVKFRGARVNIERLLYQYCYEDEEVVKEYMPLEIADKQSPIEVLIDERFSTKGKRRYISDEGKFL
jgi:hypothetical protein